MTVASSEHEVNKVGSVSVATYNILADCWIPYSPKHRYDYADKEDLLKENGILSARHQLFMKEVYIYVIFCVYIVRNNNVELWPSG